jgi:hypothetical protein
MMRFNTLTRVAAPIALPTTAQYIFCSVNRLGTPSPIDMEPAGMSPIDIDMITTEGHGCREEVLGINVEIQP